MIVHWQINQKNVYFLVTISIQRPSSPASQFFSYKVKRKHNKEESHMLKKGAKHLSYVQAKFAG